MGSADGVCLLVAGLLHAGEQDKSPQETPAIWTDLLPGMVTVIFVAYWLVGRLH